MKKKLIVFMCAAALVCAPLTGCGSEKTAEVKSEEGKSVQTEQTKPSTVDTEAKTQEEKEPQDAQDSVLADGVYNAEFHTDSGMFHVNEACDGKGVLTVEDGRMTIHISLVSKNILNLYPGLAEDAQKEGAQLLPPTTDEVTYEDGATEEVYGFDVPVPTLDEEFDLALIGEKGKWYDHKVSVSNPTKTE